jgi:hypothetical protein
MSTAPLALEVLRKLVNDEKGVYVSDEVTGEWCNACIEAGISTSEIRAHQNKAFIRARQHLIETCQILRKMGSQQVCLFPDPPPSELDADTETVGSA